MDEINDPDCCFRRTLATSIAVFCRDAGFEAVEPVVLQSLVEMTQSYMCEVARSAKNFSEHSGRSQVIAGDLSLALADIGFPNHLLNRNLLRDLSRTTVHSPALSVAPAVTSALHVGKPRAHPAYIPAHLPPFPDPHTYIQTETKIGKMNDYRLSRERAGQQRMDLLTGLVNMASRNRTPTSIRCGMNDISVLNPDHETQPYLSQLIPSSAPMLQTHGVSEDLLNMNKNDFGTNIENGDNDNDVMNDNIFDESDASFLDKQQSTIDNPYLKPPKLPKTQLF